MPLSKTDFDALADLISVTLDEVIEKKELVTKADISHLPSKDEFYASQDELMKEIKASRQEQAALSGKSSDHEDRISKLESIHPQGAHAI